MSSVSVYGGCIDNNNNIQNTFEHPRPNSDYGRSKLFIERYAKKMCLSRGLEYLILRLGHVIGAKMDRSKEILELSVDPTFQLPFNGDLASNTIHVEHLAALLAAILTSNPVKSGCYNVADNQKKWRH